MSASQIKKPTGWQRKATLLFKSEKTLGAEPIFAYFTHLSLATMKATLITPDLQIFDSEITVNASEPKRFKDLHSHFTNLQHEFLGQPLLCLYHAVLVVLLRRKFDSVNVFQAFEQLWQSEQDFLWHNLSLRWLVSSADTFVDFSPNPTRQAIFLNIPTLINTLKVYETKLDLLTDNSLPNPDKVQAYQQKHLALYDGLRHFRLGTDDTLHNMRQRYEKFANVDKFAADFLLTVFDRLQTGDTAFALMRQYHESDWCVGATRGK